MIIKSLAIVVLALLSSMAHSMETWVTEDFPFDIQKMSSLEQANRWATCAAVVNIVSEIMKNDGNTATASTLNEIANGAKTSIISVIIMGASKQRKGEADKDFMIRFKKNTEYAQMASKEYTESKLNNIMASLEMAKNKDQWMSALQTSFTRCISKQVLEVQQLHIDGIRALLFDTGK